MVKIFGLRITPFFLLIIGLQSLALLVSLYIGILLHRDTVLIGVSDEIIQHSLYSGLLLVLLLSVIAPGFFYQTRVISYIKKTLNEKTATFVIALVTMFSVWLINGSSMDARMLFITALISACVGMIGGQFKLLSKYWRFLIRSGMN